MWDENGFFVPVTLVDVSTNVVTAVKTEESDGYKAVQLGYGAIDPTKVTKPLAGHFAKAGVTPRRHLVEVRTDDVDQFEAGQELAADLFEEGAEVDVTGTTKVRLRRYHQALGLQVLPPYSRFSQERAPSRFCGRMRHSEPYSQGQAYGRPHGSCDRHYPEPDRRLR